MFFSRTAAPTGITFSIKHSYYKEIQICSNKVPGAYMAPPQGLKRLHSDI